MGCIFEGQSLKVNGVATQYHSAENQDSIESQIDDVKEMIKPKKGRREIRIDFIPFKEDPLKEEHPRVISVIPRIFIGPDQLNHPYYL